MTSSIPQKQCIKCLQFFSATPDYFLPRKDSKDGLRNSCRECFKQQHKSNYQGRKETILANKKAAYHTNPEEWRAKAREYKETHRENVLIQKKREYQKHRDSYLAYSRATYQANTDKGLAYAKDYYRAHKEQYSAYGHTYRARKHSIGGTHTAQDIQSQYTRQKGTCYYCRKKLGKNRSDYHVDHVIPIARGGSNDPSNLVIACPTCNNAKRAKLPHEWPEGGRLL